MCTGDGYGASTLWPLNMLSCRLSFFPGLNNAQCWIPRPRNDILSESRSSHDNKRSREGRRAGAVAYTARSEAPSTIPAGRRYASCEHLTGSIGTMAVDDVGMSVVVYFLFHGLLDHNALCVFLLIDRSLRRIFGSFVVCTRVSFCVSWMSLLST